MLIKTLLVGWEKPFANNAYNQCGLRALSQGLCIFVMSLNLWDLALEQKKEKAKPKGLA